MVLENDALIRPLKATLYRSFLVRDGRFYYIAQVSLKLVMVLSQPSRAWMTGTYSTRILKID